MLSNPCSVRNRSISSSGLIPGSSLRNILSTTRSSNTTEVFDCSTPISRAGAPSRTSVKPSARSKANRPCAVSIASTRSIRQSSSSDWDGSASASNVPGPGRSW